MKNISLPVALTTALLFPSTSVYAFNFHQSPNDEVTEAQSLVDGNYYLQSSSGTKIILDKSRPKVSPGGTGSQEERLTQMAIYYREVNHQDARTKLSSSAKSIDKYPTRYEFSGNESINTAPKGLEQIWLPGYKPDTDGAFFIIKLKQYAGKRYFEISDHTAKEVDDNWLNIWTHTKTQRVKSMMEDIVGMKRPVVGIIIKEPLPSGSYAIGAVENMSYFWTFEVK